MADHLRAQEHDVEVYADDRRGLVGCSRRLQYARNSVAHISAGGLIFCTERLV
jgi:hypothetical protein